MLKYLITLMAIYILISSACNSDKIKIGYLVPNSKSERYIKEQKYFVDKISALGGEAIVASAEYDDKLQITQAREMINNGVKVLVVNSVNMNTAAAIVREAHKNNVQVIAYDRLIKNSDVDYYISFDNIKVGRLMAENIILQKPEGNFVLIGGDKADLNAVLVNKGIMDVLTKPINEGKINIGYNVYIEDWSGENAYYELKQYLNLSGIIPDAILSSYDGMTAGCISALEEKGLAGKVLITGQDAELEACRNIVNGRQTLTIYKPLKALAEKAAEISFKMAANESFEKPVSTIDNGFKPVSCILLEPKLVDKSNMKTSIIADGFYSENQIYN